MAEINFNEVPLEVYRPGVFMEIDGSLSKTGLPVFRTRTVMTGHLGTNAEATAGVMYPIITESEAATKFGKDSMLVGMVKAFRTANPYQELLVVPLAELVAGQKAVGSIAISGAATRSTTQVFQIGRQRYQLGISAAESPTFIAARLATEINNDPSAFVVATNDAGTVTLTAKWKGETGNDINIFTRYYSEDYATPGLAFAITAMSGGTGNPDITGMIDALDDLTQYNGFVTPFTDTANMNLLRAEMDARFGPLSALDGRVFTSKSAAVAALGTYAVGRNSKHQTVMDNGAASASPAWEWGAAVAGDAMYYGATDPGRPFQNLELKGIMGPPVGKHRLIAERETLLANGVSTHFIGDDGKVYIERAVTTYSQNEAGADDEAYKSLNTVMVMSYYRRSVINRFRLKYPRHKLALSGHPAAGVSSNIITPETAIAEFLAHYKLMMENGLADDFDGYKADIIANKNGNVRGRLDVFDRPRPIDQFHQLAVRSAFALI